MGDGFSLLYPAQRETKESHCNTEFLTVLGLEDVLADTSNKNLGIPKQEVGELFTTQVDVCQYRMDIMEDMLKMPEIYSMFETVSPIIQNIYELKRINNDSEELEGSLFAIKELENYIRLIEEFSHGLNGLSLKSKGLNQLKDKIQEISESEEFQNLQKESAGMITKIGNIKSVTLGLNLDTGTLCVKEAGVTEINEESFHSGDIIDRLLNAKLKKDSFSCITPLVPGRDENTLNQMVNKALTRIYGKAVRSFRSSTRVYMNQHTELLIQLYPEIGFLCRAYRFLNELREKGYPLCKPELLPMQKHSMILTGVYHPLLALKIKEHVISNNITFDESGKFYLITGPNSGGKTVFLNAVAFTQAMAQLGLFVPAMKASFSLVDGIFLHYPSKSEETYQEGRLGEECGRMKKIMEQVTGKSMLLMDETFSSTSPADAIQLATEILKCVASIGCRGLYVTHLHELADKVETLNDSRNNRSRLDTLTAQMDSEMDGRRSYKIQRGKPDGNSYASDIAKKFGITFEAVMKSRSL